MSVKFKIGLEVHVQLNTIHKLFSNATSQSVGIDNTNVNIVDIGVPGTFIKINGFAVDKAIRLCRLLNCNISSEINFDRKHYSYIDLPMGYQITQKVNPIGRDGKYTLLNDKIIYIEEIHMETDAAKINEYDKKIVIDYNRCGRPLVEIVTSPCFISYEEIEMFIQMLICDLINNDISEAKLELSNIRADVNISCYDETRKSGRYEIKNLNTFTSIKNAIELCKIELSKFKDDKDFTIHYDDVNNAISIARHKETALEYLYMYEPSLPKLKTSYFREYNRQYEISRIYDKINTAMEYVENNESNRQLFLSLSNPKNTYILNIFNTVANKGDIIRNASALQIILELQERISYIILDQLPIAALLIKYFLNKKIIKINLINIIDIAISKTLNVEQVKEMVEKEYIASEIIGDAELQKIIDEEDVTLLKRLHEKEAYNYCIGIIRRKIKNIDITSVRKFLDERKLNG